ncbi:hypothetical protein AUJ13_03215 [Candidatus Micrarchaeota archaeon CG1_02_49_24]|nr:MAG: hypothetical protein AUJ13_03215 [Candidatus Micrarchaeota archaeon CG1_02_49_24]
MTGLLRLLKPFLLRIGLVLLAWQAVFSLLLTNTLLFPSPLSVLSRFFELLFGMQILGSLLSTLFKLGVSLSVGSVFGILLGVALAHWTLLYETVFPIADFFRSIPATALFPLFLLVFGLGDVTNIALSAWVCILYLSLPVSKGLRETKETSLAIAIVFKKSNLDILFKVKLMEALPALFIGLRTVASLTLVLIIVTEMFIGASSGLGKELIDASYTYDIPKLYAIIMIVGIIGYSLNLLVSEIEKKTIHWHTKQ